MTQNRRGRDSIVFSEDCALTAWATVAGRKETQGPLGSAFDHGSLDSSFGQSTWEQAERFMQELALDTLRDKCGGKRPQVVISGDLLNQCITSSLALRNRNVSHLGIYGACSNLAQALILGAIMVSGGFAHRAAAMTSSHFASAERQFRFPLGYGAQRPPCAQWTVTGAGAVMLEKAGEGHRAECATLGTVVDLGIRDSANMGAAMAPAAYCTIRQHLDDLGRSPEDYDLILTGDLGAVGAEILSDRFRDLGCDLGSRYRDCGCMIYDRERQDVHAGGSGCGCSALVLCGKVLEELQPGQRLLFCGTGALLSPTSTQQGESVPGICHAISIIGGSIRWRS